MRSILSPATGASVEGAPVPDRHREWVDRVQGRFDGLNDEAFDGTDNGPFGRGYWRAAYTLVPEVTELSLPDFRNRYRRIVGSETGWPVGDEVYREDARPRPYEGCMELWLAEALNDPAVCDYWIACPKGSFAIFRGYQDGSTGWEGRSNPGSEFDFLIPIWRVGELLLHAQRFVEEFAEEGTGLRVSMTWTGLSGRTLRNPQPGRYLGLHGMSSEQVEVSSSLEIADARRVSSSLPELVDELTRPLYEVFDFFSVPPQTVRDELDRMRGRRG